MSATYQISKLFKLHPPGIVTLAVDQDRNSEKKAIYSCASDPGIGVWTYEEDAIEDDLTFVIHNCSNQCRSVLGVHKDMFYVGETAQDSITGNEKQVVVKYKYDDPTASAPILIFSLEVTALAVSADGQYLVAGSSDLTVKCVNLQQREKGSDRYECEDQVVNISIDPKSLFFAVSTADGNVHIRTILKDANARKPIATFKCCSKFNQISCEFPRMQTSWLSNGESILIPSIGKVLIVNSLTWVQQRQLIAPDNAHDTFSVTAVSENDEFLAACTVRGQLVIWTIKTAQIYKTLDLSRQSRFVTSIVYNPLKYGSIVVAYDEGSLGVINDPDARPVSTQYFGFNESNVVGQSRVSSAMSQPLSDNILEHSARDDMDVTNLDDTEDMETDLGRIKAQCGFNPDGSFVGNTTLQSHTGGLGGLDDTIYTTQSRAIQMVNKEPCITVRGMKTRSCFLSGSTPGHESERYLMWNTFGHIRSFTSKDDSAIEVIFHDATVHPEINIDNSTTNYTMGDLNTTLVALASKRSSQRESELTVYHITAWDADSRNWSVQMTEKETIDCLTVGGDFVVLFTSLRFLRIFSAAGTQRVITCVPGPIITMNAFDTLLALIRPTGGVFVSSKDDYEHQAYADIYSVKVLSSTCSIHLRQSLPIALSPHSQLEWISFSNLGRLVSMDSDFTVRLYSTSEGFWIPIFLGMDVLKEESDDSVWPISVIETPTAQFRYAYCKRLKYPLPSKNIVPVTAPWCIPMVNQESDRSKLECQLLINEIVQSAVRSTDECVSNANVEIGQLEKNYLNSLVKLFALSCKAGKECRAAEFAHLTSNSNGIQVLCTYAAKSQRPNLSEKVASIGRSRIDNSMNVEGTSHWGESNSMRTQFSTVNQVLENRLAPSSRLLPKKKNIRQINNRALTDSDDIFIEEDCSTASVNKENDDYDSGAQTLSQSLKTQMTTKLNDTTLVSNNSQCMDFLRGKLVNCESQDADTDFFTQLSSQFRTPEVFTKGRKRSDGLQNSKDKKMPKRQAKLSFATQLTQSPLLQSVPSEDTQNDVPDSGSAQTDEVVFERTTRRKMNAYDLWREKHETLIKEQYKGPEEEFTIFLVQQYRNLTPDDKKLWIEAARKASLEQK
ncbi:minichromosome loss protein, mcl1, middle region domain-containing protein [Ditylenchus destructor]|uniref:Minichromosome loss protein, mcl1, middle region domain-containing protein n=1 Tax=Ditylenchus destructor TaxID=166010 RepID=A0AAD4RE56_9BILA|nr:minichromosome loss protein, mcl1, middle region domain-containing protein [Ditylenchus destructor]